MMRISQRGLLSKLFNCRVSLKILCHPWHRIDKIIRDFLTKLQITIRIFIFELLFLKTTLGHSRITKHMSGTRFILQNQNTNS